MSKQQTAKEIIQDFDFGKPQMNDLIVSENKMIELMESYHQSRVDSVTDDMFKDYFFDETKVNPSLTDGAIRGYKWLKQKLTNK